VSEEQTLLWEIHREVAGTAAYPFNRAQRLEFSGGFRNISFARERETRVFFLPTGELLDRREVDLESPDSLQLGVSSAALVYDTALFGGIGPILGQRYRFEGGTTLGSLQYNTALADFRRYLMPLRPLTIAARALHFGRYGTDAEDNRLQALFLGNSSLVRGYTVNSFDASECVGGSGDTCPVFDRLVGSRIAVASLELRLPLLGPLGLVETFPLPMELAVFGDAGTAWDSADSPDWAGGDRQSVTSHGASLRVNLVGMAIGQINLVHPNDRPARDWIWEFNLIPTF
jgi:outer membrane protein assembly factor BamA